MCAKFSREGPKPLVLLVVTETLVFLHRKRNQRVIYSYDKKQNSHWPLVNVLDSYMKRGPGSGIARIVEGYQFYLHTLRFIRKQNEPYLPLPSQPQLVLIYRPRRNGRLSRPWCEIPQAEIRTCNLPIGNPALYHTATSAVTSSQAVWGRLYRRLIN